MVPAMRRFLKIVLILVLVLVVLIAAGGFYVTRASFPKTDGELTLSELDHPVDVYRDSNGIPNIYADTTHDLFFAQGYAHAQDRFWQMDFERHVGTGRLSEIFGESQVETDMFLRTLGWEQIARQEWDAASTDAKLALQSYADGVNAYLADHSGASLSLEYAVLKLNNRSYAPPAWTPVDSLVWAKVMSWDLRSNMDQEIILAKAQKVVGEYASDLLPAYPDDRPVIVPDWQSPASITPVASLDMTDLLSRVEHNVSLVDAFTGPAGPDIGSNNWVLSGDLTTTGMPILANDPHLGIQMPSIWYENGLHCTTVSDACPYEVAGFSLLGFPGVVLGHNANIAWGVTNLPADVQDLYIERINPDNPNQYEVDGEWVDAETRIETIDVAGGDPVPITVRVTRDGPIISDVYGDLENFSEDVNLPLPEPYGIALKWTALQPSRTLEAALAYNRASNWDEFKAALSMWDVPSQNFIYADVEGHIGYHAPGRIPIRANGDGTVPVPGWTDDYEWVGYIPFDDLPWSYDPPEGYIVTANNAVIRPDLQPFLGTTWAYGTRAQRILDMISGDKISPDDVRSMQFDSANIEAEALIPWLLGLSSDQVEVSQAQQILENWKGTDGAYRMDADSQGAALFGALWRHLIMDIYFNDLPEGLRPNGRDSVSVAIQALLEDPTNFWWDDPATPEVETRDVILERSLVDAWNETSDLLGDAAGWTWGDLHTATFRNQTFGESGIKPIEMLFNRGPFKAPGSTDMVNATSWVVEDGYEVAALPSMRMVIDFSNLDASTGIHTTGQSGHAYNRHYDDMIQRWLTGETAPLYWERDSIVAASKDHLVLRP
jgi:penicillin G amidase